MQKKKPVSLITSAIALALLVGSMLATTAFAANANSNTIQTSVIATADTKLNAASDAATMTKDSVADAIDSADKQDAADAIDSTEKQDAAENEKENEAQDNAKETAEKAALAAKATVTEQEAIQIAEKANSGYTFTVDELGSNNGVIAYELKGTNAAGNKMEIHVDASSGALIQESDSEHND